MTANEWEALIAAHEELCATPEHLRRGAREFAVPAGATLFRTGARPVQIFWVLAGEIRLLRRSRNGGQVVLQRAASGFVAEASLDSPAYHCEGVAAAPSRLLAFPITGFRKTLAENERFRGFWVCRLAREVRALRSQCERLALRSAAERIEHYIESEGTKGRLQLSRTRKAWAAELGLTHEALYRTLARMQRAGRISALEHEHALVLITKRTNHQSSN